MPKPAIAWLYSIGIIVGIISTILLTNAWADYSSAFNLYETNVQMCISDAGSGGDPAAIQAQCENGSSSDQDNLSQGRNAIGVALFVTIVGSILMFIAWIGTLVNLSRVQRWAWFVWTIFFGGVMIFIYLVSGPSVRPKSASALQGAPAGGAYPSSGMPRSVPMTPGLPAYQPQPSQAPPPLEILQQRFARGEIDVATFQQMRALLEER